MRHYEICFIVHPDQSEQVPAMIERYRTVIAGNKGTIRGQILVAFLLMSTITAALGLYAVLGISRSGTLVAKTFESIKVPHRTGLAVTGVKAELKGAKAGPTLAMVGELDALVVREADNGLGVLGIHVRPEGGEPAHPSGECAGKVLLADGSDDEEEQCGQDWSSHGGLLAHLFSCLMTL